MTPSRKALQTAASTSAVSRKHPHRQARSKRGIALAEGCLVLAPLITSPRGSHPALVLGRRVWSQWGLVPARTRRCNTCHRKAVPSEVINHLHTRYGIAHTSTRLFIYTFINIILHIFISKCIRVPFVVREVTLITPGISLRALQSLPGFMRGPSHRGRKVLPNKVYKKKQCKDLAFFGGNHSELFFLSPSFSAVSLFSDCSKEMASA